MACLEPLPTTTKTHGSLTTTLTHGQQLHIKDGCSSIYSTMHRGNVMRILENIGKSTKQWTQKVERGGKTHWQGGTDKKKKKKKERKKKKKKKIQGSFELGFMSDLGYEWHRHCTQIPSICALSWSQVPSRLTWLPLLRVIIRHSKWHIAQYITLVQSNEIGHHHGSGQGHLTNGWLPQSRALHLSRLCGWNHPVFRMAPRMSPNWTTRAKH